MELIISSLVDNFL